MFKFLHAADIHLDSPLRGLEKYDGAPVNQLRLAPREALRNLVQLAVDEHVAFVLLAGDLYDRDLKDYSAGLFFAAQMARLKEAGIPVYVIAGNHDAANKMTRVLRFHGNVTMLTCDRPETIRLADCDVALHGQGFLTEEGKEVNVRNYPGPEAGCFNIGLLHTCVDDSSVHGRYAPCTLDDLRARGYDYWALGHIHQRQTLQIQPHIVFPGNVQGRHIRETGPKGCYLVTVSDQHHVELEFRALDVLRWEKCSVDATGAMDGDEVLARVADGLTALREASDGLPLAVRVEVTGACPAHEDLHSDPSKWIAEIRRGAMEVGVEQLWIEKIKMLTAPPSDVPPLTDGPLGELHAVLEEYRGNDERLKSLSESLADLFKKVPEEIKGKEAADPINPADPNWLREVLRQVEPLLLRRLTERRHES
jgi:DNA repair exonuclease SbcCD nuclease subunit